MKKVFSVVLFAASAMFFINVAHASIVDRYSNEADFIADGGSSLVFYGVGSPSNGSAQTLTSPYTIGPVTFIDSDGNGIALFHDGNYGQPYLANGGTSVEFVPTGGYALGFELAANGGAQKITVELNGEYNLRTFDLPDSNEPAFYGIISYVPITDLTFTNPGGEIDILGFYSDAPSVAATPEPSSIALLGTGVLSLGGIVRRRFVRA